MNSSFHDGPAINSPVIRNDRNAADDNLGAQFVHNVSNDVTDEPRLVFCSIGDNRFAVPFQFFAIFHGVSNDAAQQ